MVVGTTDRMSAASADETRWSSTSAASRWPTASCIREAALPVGAARAGRSTTPRTAATRYAAARIPAIVWVLPVPGPPAITVTGCESARSAARRWRSGCVDRSSGSGGNRASRASPTSVGTGPSATAVGRGALRPANSSATVRSKAQYRWRYRRPPSHTIGRTGGTPTVSAVATSADRRTSSRHGPGGGSSSSVAV